MKFCPQCGKELIETRVAGRKRKKCPSCDFVSWNNPTPVIAAIVEHEGSVVPFGTGKALQDWLLRRRTEQP